MCGLGELRTRTRGDARPATQVPQGFLSFHCHLVYYDLNPPRCTVDAVYEHAIEVAASRAVLLHVSPEEFGTRPGCSPHFAHPFNLQPPAMGHRRHTLRRGSALHGGDTLAGGGLCALVARQEPASLAGAQAGSARGRMCARAATAVVACDVTTCAVQTSSLFTELFRARMGEYRALSTDNSVWSRTLHQTVQRAYSSLERNDSEGEDERTTEQ